MINKDKELDDLNKLVKLLEPELKDFQLLIKNMASIESPFKNEFNHMQTMVNYEKFTKDLLSKTNLLIDELNQFGKIYDKIIQDDEICDLYVKSGLLDKSVDLKARIMNKLS